MENNMLKLESHLDPVPTVFSSKGAKFRQKINDYKTAIISIICLIFVIVGITSVKDDSLTIDELAHIPSGYVALIHQNFNTNLEHPPLIKIISAIPFIWQKIQYLPSDAPMPDQWSEGRTLFFQQGNNVDQILFSTRSAVIVFHALLIFLIGYLATFLFPAWISIILVLFIAFEPNILAHARYVTTDTGIALLGVLTFLNIFLYLKTKKFWHAVGLSIILGFVLLTKFSGVVLYGYTLFIIACFLFFDFLHQKPYTLKLFFQKIGHVTFLTLFPLLLTYTLYFLVNVHTPSRHLQAFFSTVDMSQEKNPVLWNLTEYDWGKPFASYAIGLSNATSRTQMEHGGFAQYLDGEFKIDEGWPSYFAYAWWYKTPPALILFAFISLALFIVWFFQKKKNEKVQYGVIAGLVLLFIFLYFYLSARSSLNIGIRHISPIIALVPLFGILVFLSFSFRKERVRNIFLLLCITFHLLSAALAYPFYLSYFNILGGGPMKGYTHLIDSNLDWGQNMKRLSLWAKENNITEMYVDYWGQTDINFYNEENIVFNSWHVDNGKPTSGYLAVHPMWIVHSKWIKEEGISNTDYSFLFDQKPIAHIGYGIFIYKF